MRAIRNSFKVWAPDSNDEKINDVVNGVRAVDIVAFNRKVLDQLSGEDECRSKDAKVSDGIGKPTNFDQRF